ncbi:MAG: hypothetical protein WCF77_02290 [Minisyncoccia bacterium]|jgi:uncharacterized protein (TIGR03437 family)
MRLIIVALLAATSFVVNAQPVSTVLSVTNAAAWQSGVVPGSLATVFCAGIVPAGTNLSVNPPYPTSLGGVTITVGTPDGYSYAGMVFYAGYNSGREQVNFQVPWEIALSTSTTATVTVNGPGGKKASAVVPLLKVQPALFAWGANVATAYDGTVLVTSDHPAHPGDIILVLATGIGPVEYPQTDGVAAPYYGMPFEYTGNFITSGSVTASIGDGSIPVWEVNQAMTQAGSVGIYSIVLGIPAGFQTMPGRSYPLQIQFKDGGGNESVSNFVALPIAPK